MKHNRNYTTQRVIMAISILLAAAMIILNLTVKPGRWEPDIEYEFVNKHITWVR